jgi:hypothetical protein
LEGFFIPVFSPGGIRGPGFCQLYNKLISIVLYIFDGLILIEVEAKAGERRQPNGQTPRLAE